MEELATRYLMFKAMGNPELGQGGNLGDAQINRAIEIFSRPENLSYLMELERLAAEAVRQQKPYGGPR